MKLLRLHIENFGTLQDFNLTPESGLNVLYQKNGWGKSTLAVFIKAMLYGLPATTRRSLDENERKKYTPWQGGAYGGSLDFATARGKFRVERFFGDKESADTFALYDLSTNKPSNAYSEALGVELFGIDAEGFERSTYLSQRNVSTKGENISIAAKLGNLLDDVGDIGNYDTAVAALEKRRKHYVLTGNRGAIAELEQARVDAQGELERCRSIEVALSAQEEQFSADTDELAALRKLADETHARLQSAGLARERAALREQKQSMEKELADLKERYRRTEGFFRGATPTVEEWRAYCELYDSLKEATAQNAYFTSIPQNTARLTKLRATFAAGVPTEAILARMDHDVETVRELRVRSATLRERCESDPQLKRFVNGVPEEERLTRMKARLQHAVARKKAMEELPTDAQVRTKLPALPIGIILAAVGALLVILSMIPAVAAVMLPLLIAGGALLVGGAVCLALGLHRRSKQLRKIAELSAKRRAWGKEIEENLAAVHAFLKEYRMSTDDPVRSMTELSLYVSQYWEALRNRHRMLEELENSKERIATLCERLRTGLSRYLGELPVQEDYRAELEHLRREVQDYLRQESAERKRLSDCAASDRRVAELQGELQPFLDKYDPLGTMTAGDCLQRIGEERAERSRLSREITQKEAALNAFVAEKKLNGNEDLAEAGDFDRLRAKENDLHVRIAELQKKLATLKSSIERLSAETDRISELEARAAQLEVQLNEARANSATVAHTQKFLEEAKSALSTRYLDGMQAAFRRYLDILTEGQAPEAMMDTSFTVTLREGGKTRAMESFSRGWRDAVDFCTRLSLTSALYREGEKPFLLLDDPFVNLDDKRLDAARRMLETLASEYQIFYFVCHKERI